MESAAMGSSEALEGVTPAALPRFEEFFEAEHGRLARALYLLTGSAAEADELTQEAMVRVYERWDQIRQMASPQRRVMTQAQLGVEGPTGEGP